MEVKILNEAGHKEALLGMSLSYFDNSEQINDWWPKQEEKAIKRSSKLAHMQGGHNKFIEHIEVWILVNAPLSWWKHADTYRMATKQSSSTMHTIKKRMPLGSSDFSDSTSSSMICAFNDSVRNEKDINKIADNLPDGFLQLRVWKMSYKTLQNIISQREGHKLKHWKEFTDQVLDQIERPELLIKQEKNNV